MSDNDERKIASEILKWLDTPLMHLGDESRRTAIEGILINHADQIRREAERKARIQGVAMYGGILGLFLTLVLNSGKALELLGL